MKKDCLNCGHSFSDDENRLYCALQDFKEVKNENYCEDHN